MESNSIPWNCYSVLWKDPIPSKKVNYIPCWNCIGLSDSLRLEEIDDDRNSAMALRRTLLVRQRFIPVTPRPSAYMKPFLAMDSFLASSRNDYISNSPLLSLIVISIEARMNLMIPWKLGSIFSFHGISNHKTSPTSNFHGNGVLYALPNGEYNYSVESDF